MGLRKTIRTIKLYVSLTLFSRVSISSMTGSTSSNCAAMTGNMTTTTEQGATTVAQADRAVAVDTTSLKAAGWNTMTRTGVIEHRKDYGVDNHRPLEVTAWGHDRCSHGKWKRRSDDCTNSDRTTRIPSRT
ncbi:hypothetical protein LSAT2_030915 [Lamellibrachia satsuma]|nr:hypothetical protein LSAT2_030915 [Lamellibrachia satsuma]